MTIVIKDNKFSKEHKITITNKVRLQKIITTSKVKLLKTNMEIQENSNKISTMILEEIKNTKKRISMTIINTLSKIKYNRETKI